MKLKPKIILGITAITIVSYILSFGVTFFMVSADMTKTANDNVERLNEQYCINIQNSYYELSFQIYQFVNEGKVLDFIKNPEELTDYNRTQLLKDVAGKYSVITNYVNYIAASAADDEIAYWSNGSGAVNPDIYLMHLEAADVLLAENSDNMIIVKAGELYDDEIIIYKRLLDQDTLVSEGVAVFSFQAEYFLGSLNMPAVSDEYKLTITNELGEVIVRTDIIDVKSDQYFEDISKVPKIEWTVTLQQTQEVLMEEIWELRIMLTLVTILVVLIGVYIFNMIVSNMTKSIKTLATNMEQVEQGDYSLRIKPVSYDEIGLLSLQFNHMVMKVDELINEVYIKEIEKREKEYEALQAQINPHFLYNSLGTIKWQANIEDKTEIEDYIDSLISLLKFTARTTSNFITVEKEIEYTKRYLEVQRYRSGNVFQMVYNIDETCFPYMILKFVLQPLVENTILHAFSLEVEEPTIEISVYKENENIVIDISDNGIGMTPEKIVEIYESRQAKNGMNSVGFANVNERIKMHFGEEYFIKINSQLNCGTKVSVTIPMKKLEDIEDEAISNVNC